MSPLVIGIGLVLAAVLWSPAPGQAAPSDAPRGTQAPQSVPESAEPGKSGSSSGPLSDKLDQSGGVIHPPAEVDPGIHRSPPSAGPDSMPVIPPPGTPGSGKPEVEPK